APCRAEVLVTHLSVYLAVPVHLVMFGPNATNDRAQDRILLGAGRPLRRIPLLHFVAVVRRWGDRQEAADRLDPIGVPMLINEGHHHFGRRSSSACAKNAEALRRISFARFNSRTSRSRSFIRCRSSVVNPARWPLSRSACRTHRRSVSVVHPSFGAIAAIAAHCDGCSGPCSRTIRTARSRTSGEYLVGRAMSQSSQLIGSPTIPVRFIDVEAERSSHRSSTASPTRLAWRDSDSPRSLPSDHGPLAA